MCMQTNDVLCDRTTAKYQPEPKPEGGGGTNIL